jgi:hypothetical protein
MCSRVRCDATNPTRTANSATPAASEPDEDYQRRKNRNDTSRLRHPSRPLVHPPCGRGYVSCAGGGDRGDSGGAGGGTHGRTEGRRPDDEEHRPLSRVGPRRPLLYAEVSPADFGDARLL